MFFVNQAVKYLQLMVIQARKQQKAQDTDVSNTKNTKSISIDPKTWVKLGHFHLLLEEHRKGNNFYIIFSSQFSIFSYFYSKNSFVCYSIVCISNVLHCTSWESLEGHGIPVWTRISVLLLQCIPMVSDWLNILMIVSRKQRFWG